MRMIDGDFMLGALRNLFLQRQRQGSPSRSVLRIADKPLDVDRLCFICGLHRSGTTLLETLVWSRCDVAVLRGPVPENEGQHLQDVYPAACRHGGPGRFAFAAEMRPPAPDPETAAELRNSLLRQWRPWVDRPAKTLVEKSPPNLTKIPWLRAVFPGATFLVIIRDPRAVALATRKWSGQTLPELMDHWESAHRIAQEALSDDCQVIRYEDLCKAPETTLVDAVTALNLPLRDRPLDLPDRFAAISNSNVGYLEAFPNTIPLGPVARQFGYH